MNGTWAGSAEVNLVAAWVGILLGFVTGLALGLFFRNETWLGGYTSFNRRMYRLGHISLFALGAVNLMFYLTVRDRPLSGWISAASIAFIVGAVSMPVCCLLLAHFPNLRLLFAVPVLSLIWAASLTLLSLLQGDVMRERPRFHAFHTRQSNEVVTPAIGLP